MMEAIERIAARTGVTVGDVMEFSSEFQSQSVVAVINYLEKRIENMRGDENPKFELEQIRRDLSTLVVLPEGGGIIID